MGEVEMVSVLPQYAGFMALLGKMGTYVGEKGALEVPVRGHVCLLVVLTLKPFKVVLLPEGT